MERPMKALAWLRARPVLFAIVVALGLVAAGLGGLELLRPEEDEFWARIQSRGEFVVATDASYEPFSVVDANGDLFGFGKSIRKVMPLVFFGWMRCSSRLPVP